LAARASTVASDSAAAHPAYDPAIRAYRSYLQTYPDATDAVPGLANLYYQSGRLSEAKAAFDSIYPSSGKPDGELLIEAGRGALRGNAYAASTSLLERGLAVRPDNRDALIDLGNAYLALRDSTHLLPVAQRLAGVDPLNRTAIRLLAAGWDLRGRRDSAQKYRDLADSGLPLEVAINSLEQDSSGYRLSGIASNGGASGSALKRLTFEFFDANGNVQVTQSLEIPPLPPQGTYNIDLHVPGTALIGWRYKVS